MAYPLGVKQQYPAVKSEADYSKRKQAEALVSGAWRGLSPPFKRSADRRSTLRRRRSSLTASLPPTLRSGEAAGPQARQGRRRQRECGAGPAHDGATRRAAGARHAAVHGGRPGRRVWPGRVRGLRCCCIAHARCQQVAGGICPTQAASTRVSHRPLPARLPLLAGPPTLAACSLGRSLDQQQQQRPRRGSSSSSARRARLTTWRGSAARGSAKCWATCCPATTGCRPRCRRWRRARPAT